MKTTHKRLASQPFFVILALTTLAACGQPETQSLSGSLATTYDMHYESVRAYRIGPQLVLAYQLPAPLPPQVGGFGAVVQNQVLRLTFNTGRQTLAERSDIDLLGNSDFPNACLARYALKVDGTRVVQDAPIAPLDSGTIYFDKLGTAVGEALKGHFSGKLTDGRDFEADFDTLLATP